MDRWRSFPKSSVAFLMLAARAWALDVPVGTALQIRLTGKVSTAASKVNDAVDAVVIAPVMVGSQWAIPAGALVHGTVATVTPPPDAQTRAVLLLQFTKLVVNGAPAKLSSRVVVVDNAREKVDAHGQINGILTSDTVTGKLDSEIGKLTESHSGLSGLLGAVKGAVLKEADTSIAFDAGTEMTLTLTAPLHLRAAGGAGPRAAVRPIANLAELRQLVARLPVQTVAQKPPKPSDLTNLMLIGTREQIDKAFADAGWEAAAGMNMRSKFQTLKALGEDRGYDEAPVSVLLLDGRPPDMVFEKLNDTFAKRHHLRVWETAESFDGAPVWLVAATHDTGISFSEANRTFIHRVDGNIDAERAKVANDLMFGGHVRNEAIVERANMPQGAHNATGDALATDGKLEVLVLQ